MKHIVFSRPLNAYDLAKIRRAVYYWSFSKVNVATTKLAINISLVIAVAFVILSL